jgi:hypothetical protein
MAPLSTASSMSWSEVTTVLAPFGAQALDFDIIYPD